MNHNLMSGMLAHKNLRKKIELKSMDNNRKLEDISRLQSEAQSVDNQFVLPPLSPMNDKLNRNFSPGTQTVASTPKHKCLMGSRIPTRKSINASLKCSIRNTKNFKTFLEEV